MSFGWEGMFQWFFSKSTMLANEELKIMTESMRWHEEAGISPFPAPLPHEEERTSPTQRHRDVPPP
jgi:hypothetical protein